MNIDERIKRVKDIYSKLGEIIDSFGDYFPKTDASSKVLNLIKDKVFGNKELEKFLDELNSHRPPRFFLIGRTGVGKSSLINAMCGSYLAPVSHVAACTPDAEPYSIKDGDRVLMEIYDSRGIAEGKSIDEKTKAEDMAKEKVKEFMPDVVILVLSAAHRDDINSDAEFVNELLLEYKKVHKVDLPVVVVINRCDAVDPSTELEPQKYSQEKIDNINEIKRYYMEILTENDLAVEDVIDVSSLIEWKTNDGRGVKAIAKSEYESLQIKFDGRYHIEELKTALANAIGDPDARMGFFMAARLNKVLHKLSDHFTNTFSVIASAVVALPVPLADVYMLLVVQAILVTIIAALNGEDISIESAIKFLGSMGGAVGMGFIFRTGANLVLTLIPVPFLCDAISAGIAGSGTKAIGQAAAAYYIDGIPTDKVKKFFKRENKKAKEKEKPVSPEITSEGENDE